MKKRNLFAVLTSAFLMTGFLSSCNPGASSGTELPPPTDTGNSNEPVTTPAGEPEHLTGHGEPASSVGKDGDTYTDLDTGDTYTKEDGVWVKDPDQSKHYEGAEAPNPELGSDGDTYTNTVTGDEYEKMDGVWVLVKEGDKVQKHVVTFDLAGGTINGSITYGPVEVAHGELVAEPPAPVKQFATFDGWYAQDGSKWSFLVPVMTDLTLTAHYRANAEDELTITVDPDNGEHPYDVTTFDGDYVTSKIETPTKEGYDFLGWYFEGTDERFTGTMRPEYDGLTIVARWEKAKFNFIYQVEDDGNITITGIRDIESITIVIPSEIDGHTVTKLSPSAFQNRIYLTSVTLPSTLVEFNPRSFLGCRALTEILFEGTNPYFESVEGCIYSKDKTEILFVPAKNTQGAFDIPDGVTKVGEYSFYNHGIEGVTSVNFPEGLTEIGEYAFYGNAFTSLSFPSTLKTIGNSAFSCILDGNLQQIVWNEGLESIGDSAFTGSYLKDTLEFPSTLKYIGPYAFANSTAITKVILPAGLEELAPAAFNGCTGIMEADVEDENQNYIAEEDIVYTKDMKKVVFCPSGNRGDSNYTITIPDGVTEIGDFAFYMVDNCHNFVIPNTVEKIGKSAFGHCYELPSISIPDSVTEIGEDVFQSCDNLSSVTLGTGLKVIPRYSFDYCTSLTDIVIPGNIEEIADSAFFGCPLSHITLNEGLKKIGEGAFYFVPNFSDDGYYVGETESDLAVLTLPDSLEEIGKNAFYGHTNLKQINIGSGLKAFNPAAFPDSPINAITISADNPYLIYQNNIIFSKDKSVVYFATENVGGDVILPDEVVTIGDFAFSNKDQLTTLTLGSKVETIGESAFYYASLSTLVLPDSVKEIKSNAFYSSDLTSITLNEGLETIGEGAFTYCNLEEITLPDSLITLGASAFSMNFSLTKVTFGSNLISIGNNAFQNCPLTGVITLPASLETLGEEVFYSTSSAASGITDFVVEAGSEHFSTENGLLMDKDKTQVLAYAGGNERTSLTLPETIKEIKPYAFQRAANLTSLTLNDGLERIDDYGLAYLPNVAALEIPSSVTYVGYSAFAGFRTTSTISFNCTQEFAIKNFDQYFDSSCQAEIIFLGDAE